jgi:hypothetical protein
MPPLIVLLARAALIALVVSHQRARKPMTGMVDLQQWWARASDLGMLASIAPTAWLGMATMIVVLCPGMIALTALGSQVRPFPVVWGLIAMLGAGPSCQSEYRVCHRPRRVTGHSFHSRKCTTRSVIGQTGRMIAACLATKTSPPYPLYLALLFHYHNHRRVEGRLG